MSERKITPEQINAYRRHLLTEERSEATVEKYLRDIKAFSAWLKGRAVTKEQAIAWKSYLVAQHYAPVTINAMLSALNGLFQFLGWDECHIKFLKIQRKLFQDTQRKLSRAEYERLLAAARTRGKERLALLMETICATGIRVSEIQYITVEAAQKRQTQIMLKGKIRGILLPKKLCKKLLQYAKGKKITSGKIFLTRSGHEINRKQIWAEMKALCATAGINPSKVFPHNLRHLFANLFYQAYKDIARLADILGHSSVETTRIYLLTPSTEHIRQMERLNLIT